MAVSRARVARPDAPLDEQVRAAVHVLRERGALHRHVDSTAPRPCPPRARPTTRPAIVAVVAEPDRAHMTRELLGAAAAPRGRDRGSRGRDHASTNPTRRCSRVGAPTRSSIFTDHNVEEDVATRFRTGPPRSPPWSILVGSTAWGREVASRVAARLDAGLTGDAVDLEVERGTTGRVEAGVRRSARRRDRRDLADPDGDRARGHAGRSHTRDGSARVPGVTRDRDAISRTRARARAHT